MISKGDMVYYVTEGGGIKTGTAEMDEAWGSITVRFPQGSESVSSMRCFRSARAAHIAAMNRKSMAKQ